ncbi:MAG: hypothetical protein REJ24_17715, partial [Rhodocyclaceae bacterium]|nr:hypothetical protein [Rhodocyclaceae bacterium]
MAPRHPHLLTGDAGDGRPPAKGCGQIRHERDDLRSAGLDRVPIAQPQVGVDDAAVVQQGLG